MNFFQKRKLKGQGITPKGECLYNYCRRVRDGQWGEKDYIAEYEGFIDALHDELMEETGIDRSRENIADCIMAIMNDIREVNKK